MEGRDSVESAGSKFLLMILILLLILSANGADRRDQQ
jgi:hypothetical protein